MQHSDPISAITSEEEQIVVSKVTTIAGLGTGRGTYQTGAAALN
jgi:hypothetical protein